MPQWTSLTPSAQLGTDLATFKMEGRQLVAARAADGRPFALDNRCPHEGYPLAQGDLKGCTLTCAWHNWKFDVRDGGCTLGGEPVRAYPVRERDGVVEIDLAPPDPEVERARLGRSLDDGLFRHDNGRAVRDVVRLLQAGEDPHRILAHMARYDALHGEYGSSHALALAADLGRLVGRHPGVEAALVVAPLADLVGEECARLHERPRPAPVAGATPEDLVAAVEAEDAGGAEGMLRGAIDSGRPRAEIERWLVAVMARHFTDFGHQLIYLVKAQELFDRAGDEWAAEIYPALLHATILATREDTLPYMRAYAGALARLEPELEDLAAAGRHEAGAELAQLLGAVLEGSAAQAMQSFEATLRAGLKLGPVAAVLVEAAAHRLLRFDTEVDGSSDVAETWLWATHRLTFASAVRNAVVRFGPSADTLRLLVQAVAFIHSGRPMDAPKERRSAVTGVVSGAHTVAGVVVAVVARDPSAAVAAAAGYLRAGGDATALGAALADQTLLDPVVRPIFQCHLTKTLVAAFEEHAVLGGAAGETCVLAAIRFVASPQRERRLSEQVRRSIRFVVDGVTPRKLTQ